jgi:hypothetical protein
VLGDAIALRLDQRRALTRAGAGDRLLRDRPHLEHVIAVDEDAREAVRRGAIGDVSYPHRGRDGVEIAHWLFSQRKTTGAPTSF